jgi:hypothetical protein
MHGIGMKHFQNFREIVVLQQTLLHVHKLAGTPRPDQSYVKLYIFYVSSHASQGVPGWHTLITIQRKLTDKTRRETS